MLEADFPTEVTRAQSCLTNDLSVQVIALKLLDWTFLVLGFVFNAVAIVVIVKGKKFGQKMKVQLTNLAVADILSSLAIPGGSAYRDFANARFLQSSVFCKIYKGLGCTAFIASMLCHMNIALERFIAVYFPFQIFNLTKRKVATKMAVLWLIALLIPIDIYSLSDLVNISNSSDCVVYYTNLSSPAAVQCSAFFRASLFVPAFVIFIAYIAIGLKLFLRPDIGEGRSV